MTPEELKSRMSAFWTGLLRGPNNQARRAAYQGELKVLQRGGLSKEEAFLSLTGPGGKWEHFGLPVGAGSETEVSAPGEAPAAAPAVYSPLKDLEDRRAGEAERVRQIGRQQRFKRRLAKDAGGNKDQREWAEWAARWQSLVYRDNGVHQYSAVKDRAPHPGAVALLELWCREPGEMPKSKLLAKGGELEGDEERRERKSIAEVRRLIKEASPT